MRDDQEFIQLIRDHEGILYKVSGIYAADREDQRDLYQEIVYQLWKSFSSFRGRAKLSTWIYRVALNTCITYSARTKKRRQQDALQREWQLQWEQADPVIEERIRLLYQHIQDLNVIDRGIVLLHLEGKSYEEIAGIIGFTTSNVGTRLNRIKNKLKAQFKKSTSWS